MQILFSSKKKNQMTKLIISVIIFFLIFIYRLNFYYKQTKSKSYVISIIKRDIKNLLFGFIVVFTLYWIVDKYEEATNLKICLNKNLIRNFLSH